MELGDRGEENKLPRRARPRSASRFVGCDGIRLNGLAKSDLPRYVGNCRQPEKTNLRQLDLVKINMSPLDEGFIPRSEVSSVTTYYF